MKRITSAPEALIAAIVAVVVAVVAPAGAQDQDHPRWFGSSFDDKTALVYGVPDSDDVMLHFSCAVGKPVVNIHVQDEESRAEEGTSLRVRLSAGADRIAFSGKAIPNQDSGGADVDGQLPLDDTLRRILTTTGTLEIVVDKHTQRYAMTGAAKPAAAMLAACDKPAPAGGLGTSVPASFDCAKAGNAVEKFICSRAVLRWQDLALSRSYRAARNVAVGAARDGLLAAQRDWRRERDRRCIADRTFKELSGSSTELQEQAYRCLKTVYLDRRRQLQDLAAAPLSPRDIAEIDLTPIAAARPDIMTGGEVRVADIRLSPDGALAAILLPSLELDGADQVWLYRIADRRLVAATPAPDRQQPHPDGAPAAIKATAWRGETLYARVAVWSKNDGSETGAAMVYAATIDGSRRLGEVPDDIRALLDTAGRSGAVEPDEIPDGAPDSPATVRGSRDFLVWADDLGHGTIELKMRKRAAGSPAYLVAWGSWDLWRYLFDADRSQLVHAADTGIVVFDMATRGERRIAGTAQGDLPYAISADRRLLIWETRNRCGDEFLAAQDDSKPQRLCLAHLSKPEAGR